jgi:hypothetical protein
MRFIIALSLITLSASAAAVGSGASTTGATGSSQHDKAMALDAPKRIELRLDGRCYHVDGTNPVACPPADQPMLIPAELFGKVKRPA